MKKTILTLILFFQSALAQPILVPLHGQVRLQAKPGATLVTSNGKIASIRILNGHPHLIGRGRGRATIRINGRSLDAFVFDQSAYDSYRTLEKVLSRYQGLKLTLDHDGPVVQGRLLRLSDWIELAELNLRYKFRAKIDPDLVAEVQERLDTQLKEHLLPTPHLRISPEPTILLGRDMIQNRKAYETALAPWGVGIQLGPMALSQQPLIAVKILVTELRRGHFQRLGVRYPERYDFSLLPKLEGQTQGLGASIEAIEENGHGKILASPRLLCRSGKSAEFLAGGEIPIRVLGKESGSLTWKRYGVLLKVEPKADRSGRMSLHISTEISTIDTSQVVEGVPGFLTNKIDSHFDLSESRTIALSGLIRKEEGESISGLPFLSRIPVLGRLFSSRDYRKGETELVIFVTPKILGDKEAGFGEADHGS